MSKKLISLFSIITIAVMLLSASVVTPTAAARSVSDMNIFKATKFDAHYRVPNEGAIQNMLTAEYITLPGATPQVQAQAVQKFLSEFIARNPDTPSPWKLKSLLDGERSNMIVPMAGSKGSVSAAAGVDRSIKSLVSLVEFDDAESDTWIAHVDKDGNCVDTEVTFKGPLHNQIAPPGPRDNNTIWYKDTNPDLYEQIYFGEGPNAGVTVNHPNLGDIFFKGKTMVNYYLEQSNGKFAPSGMVIGEWFKADHSEAYYGEDSCAGSHNIRAQELVQEVVDKLKARYIDWQSFDGNGDGIVDNFTVIHAGAGQEGGGGAEGSFAIWSHASILNWPDGEVVCKKGDPGCLNRDIIVREYSMDPEMVDLGVIAEEYGHAVFGLPDIYTTDAQGSPSNWAIMESGSWNGLLGGMEPAPFPLWFRYLVGWAQPKVISFDSPTMTTKVGQLSKTPKGTFEGMRINLPDKNVTVQNPLGTGQAMWSDVGDAMNNIAVRTVDLTGLAAPKLVFNSYWSIEEDWDYGYVEVSTDGQTWTQLDDEQAFFRTTNPNGNNLGVGLTGSGQGQLSFDLTQYAGQAALQVRVRYVTDAATQWNGWWIDDVQVTDSGTPSFTDTFDSGLGAWTSTEWRIVPFAQSYPRYYLVEWRNNSGYDQGLKYAYATVYSDENSWEVDRGPYTVPGMLLWLRDTSYAFDYTLYDSTFDAPSYGPKHALLVVDSHFWPYEWNNWVVTNPNAPSGAHLKLNSRLQPGNATFTTRPTTPFSIRLGFDPTNYDPAAGYLDEPIDQQSFGPLPAVPQFHDSLGYYPGLWANVESQSLWFWDRPASVTIPAAGPYTTKITWMDKSPATMLYGVDMGDTILGTGNPGDEGAQFGLHIAVAGQAGNGTYGLIRTWNAPALTSVTMAANPPSVAANAYQYFFVRVKNTSPMTQKVVVDIPIPAKTRLVSGAGYRYYTNSIHWEGYLAANYTRTFSFKVRVNSGVPAGTKITATARVRDDALGSTGSLVVTTK